MNRLMIGIIAALVSTTVMADEYYSNRYEHDSPRYEREDRDHHEHRHMQRDEHIKVYVQRVDHYYVENRGYARYRPEYREPEVRYYTRVESEPRVYYEQRPVQQSYGSYGDGSGRAYTGSIVGGVAGAIIGNQAGGGRGKTAATAIGAITGAIVGDRLQNSR